MLNLEERTTIQVTDHDTGELHVYLLTVPPSDELAMLPDDLLVAEAIRMDSMAAALRKQSDVMKMELRQRMAGRKATEYKAPTGFAKMEEETKYDQTKFRALFELIDEQELIEAGAYTKAYTDLVTVPESWNTQKVKTFSKRGEAFKTIIEGAKSRHRLQAQHQGGRVIPRGRTQP